MNGKKKFLFSKRKVNKIAMASEFYSHLYRMMKREKKKEQIVDEKKRKISRETNAEKFCEKKLRLHYCNFQNERTYTQTMKKHEEEEEKT